MAVIKIQVGLGNQLFQYAYGRAFSYRQNKKMIKLDIDNYNNNLLRSYKLKYFNTQEKLASTIEIFYCKLLKKLGQSKNSYFEGYWQSEKYFKDIENTIRREFMLKNNLSDEAEKIANNISVTNSVSLHIRRGDYITNDKLKNILQLLPLSYYESAIELITKKVEKPLFFIFSDDMDWVKNKFRINNHVIYVSSQEIQDYEELALMSFCSHNITANSTFSWWGAWLNENPNKIVIAPKDWFVDKTKNSRDLIPDSWIQI